MPIVTAPAIEHHRDPRGIGEERPRVSWKTQADDDWAQAGYELESQDGEGRRVSSGRFTSSDSVLVPWPFPPLRSRQSVRVRVRVWGGDGAISGWSPGTQLEVGLLSPDDWVARPVTCAWPEDPESDTRRPPLVRRAFTARRPVAARLYVTAHGLYEVELNGVRVGTEAMAPGWSVYGARLRYATYDVTAFIGEGENAIGAWLGDGWYRGRLGFRGGTRNLYGSDLSLIAQLELRYADGSVETVPTDETWRAAPGPILSSGIYDGEVHDARLLESGWSSAGFDDSHWSGVRMGERDTATLAAPIGPPVRCTQEVVPVEVLTTPSGKRVLDLGQNLVGRMRIRVSGERGRSVTLRTAEVLQNGELYTRPLRSARSTDVYVLAGDGHEEWEPRFTFHGFRYVEVEGWPGDLEHSVREGDLVARVLHTDMERTGWFECSNELVNRLHRNVVWGMRGNFLDVPTDCPQRDERLGWTGDIQVFAPTAAFLYDCSGMLGSWLRDVAEEQLPDGTVPWYVPVIPGGQQWTPIRPGAVWGDVAVLTPWALFEAFGDEGVLTRQYASARAWVDLVERLAGPDRLWNEGFQLGDWLDPSAPPENPADARTDRYLVATAYFAWSCNRLAETAGVLGRSEEAAHYSQLAAEIREAFLREYLDESGRLTSDAQTAYALAIAFRLAPQQSAAMGARLAELASGNFNRIATGFAGTPAVLHALSGTGHVDAAYRLLLEQECPSWLYSVVQGATTMWERWDSLLPDGSVNPGEMTSFNHYAFGSVADWLHRVVAGLAPGDPGYRFIRFRPRPGGNLTSASASVESPYGRVAIDWRHNGSRLEVAVIVPTGSTASLEMEGMDPVRVGPGTHRFEHESQRRAPRS